MFKIKDWEKHFETAKTKTFNRCQRLTFSNDLSDPHFRRLVRGHKDGYAHFGIWVAICEFHSSQSKPRLGYLTDDGQESGNPLSISEIADLIRAPEKVVAAALERLSDPYVGWITDERRPCDDQTETMVGVQSSSLSTPLHSTPHEEALKDNDAGTNVPSYLTYKKRKLIGIQLEGFNKFWKLWRHPRYGTDKSRAADSWVDLPWPEGNKNTLENRVYEEKILYGARKFIEERDTIIEKGDTPKYAQGWLTERRFETYVESLNEEKLRAFVGGQMEKESNPQNNPKAG